MTPVYFWQLAESHIIGLFNFIWSDEYASNINKIKAYLLSIPANSLPPENAAKIANELWAVDRFVLCGLFCFLAWKVHSRTIIPAQKQTIETLIESQAEVWPHLHMFNQVNPLETSETSGDYAFRQKPWEFAAEHGLIENRKLDFRATEDVFFKQIGAPFKGWDRLTPEELKVAAVCIARISGQVKAADQLLDELSLAAAKKRNKADAMIKQLMAKGKEHAEVKRLVKQHAHTRPLLCSLLKQARESGVLPAHRFYWLKPIDRTLWYALSDVGLQTASAEAAGVRAHWLLECHAKKQIFRPYVTTAVKGLSYTLGLAGVVEDERLSQEESSIFENEETQTA